MTKLNVVIMGQNCEKFIGMCLESVKDANAIYYLDGGSKDNTFKKIKDFVLETKKEVEIEFNKFDQEDILMNSKQKNFFLDHLKAHYLGEWVLYLDADEVLEDFGIQKIKQTINQIKQPMILSPRIHHFVGDLGHEDFTKENHFVPNRLFKVSEDLFFPDGEHTVLQGKSQYGSIDVHIWHLRECLGIFETQKKHKNNLKKSDIHNKSYLDWWHKSMLFGTYPKKQVYYGMIPTPIKRSFEI